MSTSARFASCDWGTSRFRLRIIERESGSVLARTESDRGVRGFTAPDAFAAYLSEQLTRLESAHGLEPAGSVWISGMASSTIGWREVPYARLPFALDGSDCRFERSALPAGLASPERSVFLVSGVASADDILRGEETELIGLAARGAIGSARGATLVILPGTHSKHALVGAHHFEAFATYMTGELFDVYARATILAHSVGEGGGDVDWSSFIAGIDSSKDGAARWLFRVRTRAVLDGATPNENRGYLSGLLIGDELRSSPFLRDRSASKVVLAASGALLASYRTALDALSIPHDVAGESDLNIAAAHRSLDARIDRR